MRHNDTTMLATEPALRHRWCPQPRWLGVGLGAGSVIGASVGALKMTASALLIGVPTPGDAIGLALVGGLFGGVVGSCVGLAVGLVMTFLGGSHLRSPNGKGRAFLVTSVATGLIFLVPTVMFWEGSDSVGSIAFFVAPSAIAGGLVSYWLAPRMAR